MSVAAEETGVSARSAYRLRNDPAGKLFREAWDMALGLATGRLATIAFERALRGEARETWRDGELVAETREPSDKLLMFLLRQLDRRRFGPVGEVAASQDSYAWQVAAALPRHLDKLADVDAVEAVPLCAEDYDALAPRRRKG